MYPTHGLELCWDGEWERLLTAGTPEGVEWLRDHMRALAADADRPAKALSYRLVRDSPHLGQPPEVLEVAQ